MRTGTQADRKALPKVNHDGWAAIMGIVNGLFLTSVLLPRLITIVSIDPTFSAGGIAGQAPLQGLLSLIVVDSAGNLPLLGWFLGVYRTAASSGDLNIVIADFRCDCLFIAQY